MADYDRFRWGGVTFPLTTALDNSLLRDADPALYWALQFWTQILTTHVQARLLLEAAACGAPVTAAVKSTIAIDPAPLLEHAQVAFPLLAAYRVSARYAERTVVWEHEQSEWEVQYILPALNEASALRLVPILHAIGLALENRTAQGFDPAFLSGARVWGGDYANVERIGFASATLGRYEGASGIHYYAWQGKLAVREREMPAAGAVGAFAGADVQEDVVDSTGTTENVVSFRSDVTPPTS